VVLGDAAAQFAGTRGGGHGDSGLSGRIYGMLAREMADTDNRGKILWIFATSRPDMLEVDLKRQGRLDVHIPLFPPEDEKGKRGLFMAMAKKLGLSLKESDYPQIAATGPISGNELEGLLVRAVRRYELSDAPAGKKNIGDFIKAAAAEFRPSAHTTQLELMDLLAVRECTDDRFLPPRFRKMEKAAIEKRIGDLLGA
jgi:SpoVK/Ycf46/Vps4 family AAA+-type ATPase